MKLAVVPAQVTTVEDRIAGNLGLSQLLLLATPIFGSSALYAILPPAMHNTIYKLVFIITLTLISWLMAIRIKGKLILDWLVIILGYNLRPRYYIFNKNSLYNREPFKHGQPVELELEKAPVAVKKADMPLLTMAEILHLQTTMENSSSHLAFRVSKGSLRVYITEVKS